MYSVAKSQRTVRRAHGRVPSVMTISVRVFEEVRNYFNYRDIQNFHFSSLEIYFIEFFIGCRMLASLSLPSPATSFIVAY